MADDVSPTPVTPAEVLDLWSGADDKALPGVGSETHFSAPVGVAPATTMLRNVSHPTLTVVRPDPAKANGVGVIICPGGGWRILAWEHEGADLATWLSARGYTAFLLKYRVAATPADPEAFARRSAASSAALSRPLAAAETPRSMDRVISDEATLRAREAAAEDGRRALAMVRERAADFAVDPARVGLIGFSAGAFLVVDVALKPGGPPPAFVAPIYGGETRGRAIPADAPPLFSVVAQDDRLLVSIVRGLCDDWFAADRPVESHMFARGGHGFGMIPQDRPCDAWTRLLEAWLADQGLI